MSLEQQLIRGAYGATGADTQGIVARAQNKMLDDISKAAASVAEEKEKLEKDKQALVQSYEKDFERIQSKYIDDGGLPIEAWETATKLAQELKNKYNSHPIGKEGDMLRRKNLAELRDLGNQWSNHNESLDTLVSIQNKIDSGDHPEHSNYMKRAMSGIETMAMRAAMKPGNHSYESKPGFKTTDQEFFTAQEVIDGMVYKTDDAKLHLINRAEANEKNEYKGWNRENSLSANKNAINPKNITSIYYDDIIGNVPLKDELKDHPIFKGQDGKGAKYSDLGIDISGTGTLADGTQYTVSEPSLLSKEATEKITDIGKTVGNQDDIIDENEIEAIIDALADPANPYYDFDTSREVAAFRMTQMEEKMMNTYKNPKPYSPIETYKTETGGFDVMSYKKEQ